LSTLEEELAHVQSYLTIERARFEDRLTVETDIDPSLFNLRVPAFTLQPLIENAIKHGIATTLGPGVVKMRAYRTDDAAIIEIEDDAGAFFQDNGKRDGLGLKIVDRRLKLFMGINCGATIFCVPNEMTRATIRIPLDECRS